MSKMTITWEGEPSEIGSLIECFAGKISNSLVVESVLSEAVSVPAASPKKVKLELTQEQKTRIIQLHLLGKSVAEIKEITGLTDGRQVHGVIVGEDLKSKRPAAEIAPAPAKVPASSLSRSEVDAIIWGTWKGGEKDLEKISDALYEKGIMLNAATVRRRLLQQGAAL